MPHELRLTAGKRDAAVDRVVPGAYYDRRRKGWYLDLESYPHSVRHALAIFPGLEGEVPQELRPQVVPPPPDQSYLERIAKESREDRRARNIAYTWWFGLLAIGVVALIIGLIQNS